MQAEVRTFFVNGREIRTPILIPSFSSRGFDDVKKIIKGAEAYITECTLISAFDLHHKLINKRGWAYPEFIFLDSGGYEFGVESDLSDHKLKPNNIDSKHWSPEKHKEIIFKWHYPCPTILISYDDPSKRPKMLKQVSEAIKLFETTPKATKEILLKAEEKVSQNNPRSGYVKIESIETIVDQLDYFDIIGVTEKELGRSFTDKLEKIYKIRTLLSNNGINKPLHIFGSLDPISTPLYFIAGADIFDGLTWLRFGYLNGSAIYRNNYSVLELSHIMNDTNANIAIHPRNYNELMEINARMKRFLNENDFSVFGEHEELFTRCIDELRARIGD